MCWSPERPRFRVTRVLLTWFVSSASLLVAAWIVPNVDMANFDRSVVTNVPGQSADPRSKHYGDLLPLWANDTYFPLVYSRERVEKETEQVLWLQPSATPAKRR